MHRRAFLDPRRLAESAGQVIGVLQELHSPVSPPVEDVDITLVRYARPAMGTIFEIVLPFGHSVPTSIIHEAFDLIDDLESQLTIYRETSEVSDLNRRAFREAVQVSPELFELLELSQTLSRQTGGAFDVTSGALIHAWGFVRGPKRVPSELERQTALTQCGWPKMRLDRSTLTVRYLVEGLQINLGSIGKGYALDRVANFFQERCPGQPVLLHGGKSSVIGVGTPPGSVRGWSVGLEHPWNPETPLATIYLHNQAMATSAATYKHLVHEGKKLGHLLDPRTGWPAQGIASASVLAPSAALADALATAFYLFTVDTTVEYCRNHETIGTVVLQDGIAEPVVCGL